MARRGPSGVLYVIAARPLLAVYAAQGAQDHVLIMMRMILMMILNIRMIAILVLVLLLVLVFLVPCAKCIF